MWIRRGSCTASAYGAVGDRVFDKPRLMLKAGRGVARCANGYPSCMSEYRDADEADLLEQATPVVPDEDENDGEGEGEDASGDEEYPHEIEPDEVDPAELSAE